MSTHPEPAALAHPERLPEEGRRALLLHVAGCGRCRASYLAEDPARAFSLLAARPVPSAVLDRVTAEVLDRIEAPAVRPVPAPIGWRAMVPAAWAAALVMAAGLFLLFQGGGDDRRFASGPPLPADEPLAPAASVALLDSPGEASVVDLTVGETQLVMIFDEEMDL